MTEACKILLTILLLPGIGRKTITRNITISENAHFDAEAINNVLKRAAIKCKRIREYSEDEIESAISKATTILENCNNLNINISSFLDDDYPLRLRKIDDPPVLLYYKGNISIINHFKTVAIIGTREPTDFGYRIAVRMGETLTNAGFISISGLALGCDTGGHTGSVDKHGLTVAILANGLDDIYPKANVVLAERILSEGGCIISEYPPYAELQRGYFVDRDRLQAALSDAIFVVETGIEGGTMHTVHFAQKYEKTVYCFNHPEKYKTEAKVLGNQKMILDKIALPVTDSTDVTHMINSISEMAASAPSSSSETASMSEKAQQISMWPI